MDDETLVLVGEIVAPFGIRGEAKMRPLMAQPETLTQLPAVWLERPDGRCERRRVLRVRQHQGAFLVALEGIDRNEAETLPGAQLRIARSECPPLGPDEWYDWQLVGLAVRTESGRALGTIERVYFYPANDVYETPTALIPAIADVIVAVDLDAKTMTVRDVPGLGKDE